MTSVIIRDMKEEDEYYVFSCSHANNAADLNKFQKNKKSWFYERYNDGARAKVALVDGKRRGFVNVMPIELCPVEPLGTDLMSIPCLFVSYRPSGSGIGRALIVAAEEEAKLQGKEGIVTIGNYNDFWFMPGSFFEKCGYTVVKKKGERAIMWKVFKGAPNPPVFFKENSETSLISGKIVLDLFWMTFCGAEDKDVVCEVMKEFDDEVVLREHCVDDRELLLRHQINRGLFVNGKKVDWDYEDPKKGVRLAIRNVTQKKRERNSHL